MNPRHLNALLAVFLLFGLGLSARADYGWIPEYQRFAVKAGVDIKSSDANFDSFGALTDITANDGTGAAVGKFSDLRLWLAPEYGIAEDWAVSLQFGYNSASVSSLATGNTLLTGSGLSDIWAAIKYNVKSSQPILTFELKSKFPAGSAVPAARDELATGDGNLDLAFVIHTGHRTGKVTFSLSPGFMFRSGGYASAILADASLQIGFPRGYVRAFGTSQFSIEELLLSDSAIDSHDTLGSGGSYLRLAGSPSTVFLGGLIGVKLYNEYYLEGGGGASIFGYRAPNYWQITIALKTTFDFYKPEKKKRIREIPLDSEGNDKFYQN